MAAAVVTFDGTRLNDAEALGSVWTDDFNKAANLEPDFVYQGSNSVSEKVGTSEGGVAYVHGSTIDFTTPKVWISKHIATNSSAMNNKGATGGILEIGSGGHRANYDRYYVVGGDTYPLLGGWLITPIDPNGGNQSARPGTAPTLTSINYFGWVADFGATSKSENVAHDAMDHIDNGSGLTCLDGIGGTDGNFALFATTDEDAAGTNRWGIVSTREGILYVTGVLTIGDSGTGAEFTSVGEVVVWPDAEFLNSVGFFGLDVSLENASTVIVITNSTFISRGTVGGSVDTRAIVEFIGTTATLAAALSGCNFQNLADFIMTSKVGLAGCAVETASMTQGGGDIERCVVTTTSLTSIATLQDPTFGSTTGLNNTEFVQGGAGHAVEIPTVGSYTLTEMTWTGYGATASDSAALDLTASTGTYDLSIVGGVAPTYKTAGATVNILNNVTVTLTGMRDLTEVRVYAAGTQTELAGIEDATAGSPDDRSFAFSLAAATSVDIKIFSVAWDPIYIEAYEIPATPTSLPQFQRFDRNYSNPV